MVPVLYFSKAEEGTKEGDDEGVPPISQRGERRWRGMRAGCVGHARSGQATHVRPRALAGQRGREGELGQQLGARGVWGRAGPTQLLGMVWLLASWAKGMDRPQAGPDGLSIFLFHFLSFYLLPIG